MSDLSGWDKPTSPYHEGERALHERLGVVERAERIGRRVIRRFMPEQHRSFFASLPFIVVGSVDANGAPWSSVLFGDPGFIETPTMRSIRIRTGIMPGDPLAENLIPDAPISLVGIELPTRRRNRANARVSRYDQEGIELRLTMSFGNCPKYIQTREPFWRTNVELYPYRHELERIDQELADLIGRSDSLFVASHNHRDDPDDVGGVDVNHRGGRPGFVKVEGNTLTVPDFRGNNAFNTLGNFLINPRAGLVFIDFETGDIAQLTGTVELLWDLTPEIAVVEGAQRAWRFTFESGHILKNASPLGWTFGEYSPQTKGTGIWPTSSGGDGANL